MSTIGTVIFMSAERAFAFVSPADGRDVFLPLSRVAAERRAAVAVGERVEFERAVRTHPSQASR
jgi:cold shock CspA family protein